MTTTVETLPSDDDGVEMAVRVTTEDATGETRMYDISILENNTIDSAYVLGGRRVDDDAPDKPAGGGATAHAYDAAAARFKAAGYEVWNR